MKQMKLLLYCTKAKPYLFNDISAQKYLASKGIDASSFALSNDKNYG